MKRRIGIHAGLLAAALIACVAVNWRQPLVRNGLVYAHTAWNIIAAGYDPRPVVANARLSYNKPVGFASVSAPLVARFGAHAGLRLVSLAGTLAYLLATLFLARILLPAAMWKETAPWVLWLASLGPLVLYQAWSAHPDSWFAALFAVSMALTHGIAAGSENGVRRRAGLLTATLLVAFLFKNYALILLPSCFLYVLLYAPCVERRGWHAGRRLLWCGVAVGIVGVFALAAKLDLNPLSRLEGEGGGAEQYALRQTASIWWKTLVQCGIALGLQFHVLLVAAFGRGNRSRDAVFPWLCFGLVMVLGLLPFPTAFYNMRYFMPLFPLVAIGIIRGAQRLPRAARRGGALAFLLANLATSLIFNVPAVFDRVRPYIPDLQVAWLAGGPRLSLLDNLRMQQHRDQAAWLQTIDRNAGPGATLYMVDVFYYRDAEQTIFERDGFIRRDVTTHYVAHTELHPQQSAFYVYSFPVQPLPLEGLGHVTDLGNHVFRIEPGAAPTPEPAVH